MKIKLLFLVLFTILLASFVYADQCEIYFFYSKTCPHCAEEKVFLDEMEEKYPELDIQRYDVSKNSQLFEEISKQCNTIPVKVPRTYINGTAFLGFTPENGTREYLRVYEAYIGYKNQLEKALLETLGENATICDTDITHIPETSKTYLIFPIILLLLYLLFFFVFRKKIHKNYLIGAFFGIVIVSFFYISQHIPSGDIIGFAKQFSFPVFTFIVALIDGFNPCAFAVLAILLSLLIYIKSKKKLALIGTIFILTSGIMYFIFMVIILKLRSQVPPQYQIYAGTVVGSIALIAGIINVKDFFFFKKGVSLTISQDRMSKITKRMRQVIERVKEAKTFRAMSTAIIGTIILAILVNMVELGCTLILPLQFSEVLFTNYGEQLYFTHYAYIAFYSIVYIIPLLFILGSFLYTFKSERMTETKGRILKLISGIVMIGLGLILLLRPELLVFG